MYNGLEGHYALHSTNRRLAEREHTHQKRKHAPRPSIISRIVASFRRNEKALPAEPKGVVLPSPQREVESAC